MNTYTYINPITLEAEFPDEDVVREYPPLPLQERTPKEIAELKKHPFFNSEEPMNNIKDRLDKIIELLELRNSIERARDQMRKGTIYIDPSEIFPDNPQNAADSSKFCNCGDHKSGESTGGNYCPIHGQQF